MDLDWKFRGSKSERSGRAALYSGELPRTRYLVTKCVPCQTADAQRDLADWQALVQRTEAEATEAQ